MMEVSLEITANWGNINSDESDMVKSIYYIVIDDAKFDTIAERIFAAIYDAFSDSQIELVD